MLILGIVYLRYYAQQRKGCFCIFQSCNQFVVCRLPGQNDLLTVLIARPLSANAEVTDLQKKLRILGENTEKYLDLDGLLALALHDFHHLLVQLSLGLGGAGQ